MTPVTKSRIAISYSRWSTARQSEGSTEERQLELAREYASRHGLKLEGRNLQPGAALHSLVEAIKDGKIPRDAVILVESQDRLSRLDPLTALDSFRSILSLGVSVVTLQDNKVWTKASLTGESFGDLVLSLVSADRFWSESDVKSRRVRAAWEIARKEAASSKKIITASAPAWLLREGEKWKVIPERANVVRKIFELHAGGMGAQAICRRLTGMVWRLECGVHCAASETARGDRCASLA
jgi:DNA invertase Pin-like site-specific DNA recombinase